MFRWGRSGNTPSVGSFLPFSADVVLLSQNNMRCRGRRIVTYEVFLPPFQTLDFFFILI